MRALIVRDLRLALRAGGGFGQALGFFLIVVVLVPFGIGADSGLIAPIAPGLLWVTALLASLLSLDRIFALDHEDGSLTLLATAPIPLEAVVLGKSVAHWATTGLPITLAAPLLGILLQIEPRAMGWLAASLLLGTPALTLIGSFGAALTVGLSRGGLLLSLLVLPLNIPTLIFGSELVRRGAAGQSVQTPLLLLMALSLGALAVLPFATAAALKVSLR